jgi:DNA-binding CsgD family transcriptional regulator
MLLCVPILGTDGTFFGICGFEISESYFASYYAQPTKVDHLTYLFLPSAEETIDITSGFSCGDTDGYYRAPQGVLTTVAEGHGLYSFHGDVIPYLGITDQITLSPNNPDYTLGVLMRKADYDLEKRTETIKNVSLWSVLLIAAVGSCYYFSRRFLSPILHSLEQLKTEEEVTAFSNIPEIADLFEFLSEKDRLHEESLSELAEEKQTAESEKESLLQEYERVQLEYLETQRKLRDAEHSLNETQEEHKSTQTEFEKAQLELQRLAYSRQAEIDPDAYIQFLDGIETLTPTERKIFNYYLDGLNVKEIAETISVKESTVYSHNKNIYSKLGINSLKQLLRYSALMRQQEEEAADQG